MIARIIRSQRTGRSKGDGAGSAGIEGGGGEQKRQDMDRPGGRQGPVVPVAAMHRKVVGMSLHAEGDPTVGEDTGEGGKNGTGLFPEVRLRATDEADPSLVAKLALDICQSFNRFYHA